MSHYWGFVVCYQCQKSPKCQGVGICTVNVITMNCVLLICLQSEIMLTMIMTFCAIKLSIKIWYFKSMIKLYDSVFWQPFSNEIISFLPLESNDFTPHESFLLFCSTGTYNNEVIMRSLFKTSVAMSGWSHTIPLILLIFLGVRFLLIIRTILFSSLSQSCFMCQSCIWFTEIGAVRLWFVAYSIKRSACDLQ